MISQNFFHGIHLRSTAMDCPKGIVVCIHGLGGSGLCFEELMNNPLLKDVRFVAPDLPGYGKSLRCDTPLGIPEQAENLADLLSSLDIRDFILLGHSMGGVIGTVLCERYPQMIRSFIDVEGNISLDDCTFSHRIAAFSKSDFIAHGIELFRSEIHRQGHREKSLRVYHEELGMCDPWAIHRNSIELIELSGRSDLADRLRSLKMPACYVWGSPGGTKEHSLSLLRSAGVPLVEICDAGHWPFIDQSDTFAEKLLKIIDAHPQGRCREMRL